MTNRHYPKEYRLFTPPYSFLLHFTPLRLSSFHHHNLGISSVLAILAHYDVVLIAGYTEASALDTLLLYLIAPVTCVVVKELDGVAIEFVLLIDE